MVNVLITYLGQGSSGDYSSVQIKVVKLGTLSPLVQGIIMDGKYREFQTTDGIDVYEEISTADMLELPCTIHCEFTFTGYYDTWLKRDVVECAEP